MDELKQFMKQKCKSNMQRYTAIDDFRTITTYSLNTCDNLPQKDIY